MSPHSERHEFVPGRSPLDCAVCGQPRHTTLRGPDPVHKGPPRKRKTHEAEAAHLDVERLARALAMVNFGYHEVGTATRMMAEQVAAEYEADR